MSETTEKGDGCMSLVVVIVGVVLIIWIIRSEVTRRDNWIMDLQRRVAELEQRK